MLITGKLGSQKRPRQRTQPESPTVVQKGNLPTGAVHINSPAQAHVFHGGCGAWTPSDFGPGTFTARVTSPGIEFFV